MTFIVLGLECLTAMGFVTLRCLSVKSIQPNQGFKLVSAELVHFLVLAKHTLTFTRVIETRLKILKEKII